MKALKHLHRLAEALNDDGEHELATQIEGRAMDLYLEIAASIKNKNKKKASEEAKR